MNSARQKEFLIKLQKELEIAFGSGAHRLTKEDEWSLEFDLRTCQRPPPSKVYDLHVSIRPTELFVRMSVGIYGMPRDPTWLTFYDFFPLRPVPMDGQEAPRLIELVNRYTDDDLRAYHTELGAATNP